ncbi:MAG: hypothetical protein K2X74_21370, partial [Acetobacteraceae bacterium]|nr:hypothetical protein [Acetobacteraceae bacterium]
DLVRPWLRHQHAPGTPLLAPAARLHALLRTAPPVALCAAAAPVLAAFEALLHDLDAAPGGLERAFALPDPDRLPLLLPYPFADGAAEMDTPLPDLPGARLRLRNGNPWTLPMQRGLQLHPNAPGTPDLDVTWEGLPAAPGGTAFATTLLAAATAPPLRLRVALARADDPGRRTEAAWDVPPGATQAIHLSAPEGDGTLAIRVTLAPGPGVASHQGAAVMMLAPRLEAAGLSPLRPP